MPCSPPKTLTVPLLLSMSEQLTHRWCSYYLIRKSGVYGSNWVTLLGKRGARELPMLVEWPARCCCRQRLSVCSACCCTLMQQSSQCSLPMSACVKGRGLGFWTVLSSPFEFSSSSSFASAAGFVARNHLSTPPIPCSSIACSSTCWQVQQVFLRQGAGPYIW